MAADSTANPPAGMPAAEDGDSLYALPYDSPEYEEGVVDLLGTMAYGELQAFLRLSGDSALAPTSREQEQIAQMAVNEFGHYVQLKQRIEQMGRDPYEAMSPFEVAVDGFHTSTAPADYLEGLVKAYVGDGIAMDFYRMVAQNLDPDTRTLVNEVCGDLGYSRFFIATIREAIESDPQVAGRLALWGRRLVGEMIAQSQQVAVAREALVALVLGGAGPDLAGINRMFVELTEAHAGRMRSLGLDP